MPGSSARLTPMLVLAAMVMLLLGTLQSARSQEAVGEAVGAVLRLYAEVPADVGSSQTLGSRREGNGVVIDGGGLVLTIGYLIVEAMAVTVVAPDGRPVPTEIVAYDYDSGFGLVRALEPLGVRPVTLGDSATLEVDQPVLVAAHGGTSGALPAILVSRRPFAGYWEYLLDEALFTAPAHMNWGGAALIGTDGRLLGLGSLMVQDAGETQPPTPGNMFLPINLLKPILSDLLIDGRAATPPRPWLGVTSTEVLGRPLIARVTPDGPAAKAGIRPGDLILGVGAAPVSGLADFYRKIWALGEAGVTVPLMVMRDGQVREVPVTSASRYDYLRLNHSY